MEKIRKIIHVDMDAYYASVETLDNPSLKNVPLVVGGSPESRGVVCTANYVARKFGVRSAMACSVAKRLCPTAVFLPPRFSRYKEISDSIRKIFQRYTDLIEPLSLDEAYLDVTDNGHGLYATQIAVRIQNEILAELGLTCSAGVAPNKLVAKIASDFKKPFGITVVTPDRVAEFMRDLPVRKIHGVGPATEGRLHSLGIAVCRDFQTADPQLLIERMGNSAQWLLNASQGIDHRPVVTSWERKSYGKEDTFSKDILDRSAVQLELRRLSVGLAEQLKRKNIRPKTITLKVKYFDFETITRSQTMSMALETETEMFDVLNRLLCEKTNVGQKAVRLIGCSVSNF